MATRGPALEGTLDELPMAELLRLLSRSAKSGSVEVFGANPGLVWLDEGRVTLAVSDNGPSLEQVFVGSGLTTPEGWERAVGAARVGTPLIDSVLDGGAEPERLRTVLLEQTVGAVFELCLPSGDTFVFTPMHEAAGSGAHELGGTVRFEVADLLAEAERRTDAWRVIAEAIPSTAMVMRLAPVLPAQRVTISADEWRVLALVDGRSSIADIIRTLGMSAFAVCGVLHRLAGLGAVEPVPSSP